MSLYAIVLSRDGQESVEFELKNMACGSKADAVQVGRDVAAKLQELGVAKITGNGVGDKKATAVGGGGQVAPLGGQAGQGGNDGIQVEDQEKKEEAVRRRPITYGSMETAGIQTEGFPHPKQSKKNDLDKDAEEP